MWNGIIFNIPYSGKYSRDKIFADFVVCLTSAKILSANLGVRAVLSRDSGQHPRKFYPRIFIFGAIREIFVPRKFPAIR